MSISEKNAANPEYVRLYAIAQITEILNSKEAQSEIKESWRTLSGDTPEPPQALMPPSCSQVDRMLTEVKQNPEETPSVVMGVSLKLPEDDSARLKFYEIVLSILDPPKTKLLKIKT